MRNGPVPTGFVPIACGSAWKAVGETMLPGPSASSAGKATLGSTSTASTVSSSITRQEANSSMSLRQRQRFSGLAKRSQLATTASALSGVPSWNLMPGRSWIV